MAASMLQCKEAQMKPMASAFQQFLTLYDHHSKSRG